jgi:hypothetical protein
MTSRSAPTVLDVAASELWTGGVTLLWLASALAGAGWAAWSAPAQPVWLGLVLGLLVLGVLVAAWPARRTVPVRLRWDGAQWWLGAAGEDPTVAGRVDVMMDCSVFLLLRFRPDTARDRARWIPASRGGLRREWHALRAALYSARPGAGLAPSGEWPRNAPHRPDPPA